MQHSDWPVLFGSMLLSIAVVFGAASIFALLTPLSEPWLDPFRAWAAIPFAQPSAGQAPAEPQHDGGEPLQPSRMNQSPAWTDRDIEAALMECVHLLAPVNAEVVPIVPIRNGACGAQAPLLLRSFGSDHKVIVDPPLLINCPMVVALYRWFESEVQPAAQDAFGSPVARIVGSSYSCRTVYHVPSNPLSQHAFANAVDLPAFTLADGRTVELARGWGPTARDLTAAAKAKLVPIVAKETSSASPAALKPGNEQASGAGNAVAKTSVAAKLSSELKASVAPKEPPSAEAQFSITQGKFLRQIHRGACKFFTTVLGPEANDVHRTHLHLDLQERNALNVCQ
jgi:hypothetical protein